MSELAAKDAGWQLVQSGDSIPYELAFVLSPERADPTPAVRAEGERIVAEYADRLA